MNAKKWVRAVNWKQLMLDLIVAFAVYHALHDVVLGTRTLVQWLVAFAVLCCVPAWIIQRWTGKWPRAAHWVAASLVLVGISMGLYALLLHFGLAPYLR